MDRGINKQLCLGSFVEMNSSTDYLIGTVKTALENDADTFMFFTGPPMRFARKNISELKVQEFNKLIQQSGYNKAKIIVHAPYIINLANCINEQTRVNSVAALRQEINRMNELGLNLLVLHPGSSGTGNRNKSLLTLALSLNEVLTEQDDVIICLETMAGKGNEVGINFYELKTIIDNVNLKDKVGVCIDTCHIHDAGYDVKTNFNDVLDLFDKVIGLDKLKCMHINDSKNLCGSHKDRHQNIGYGQIGFKALYEIVNNPRLYNIPKVLETPYVNKRTQSIYKQEIKMLKTGEFSDQNKDLIEL